MNTRARTSSYLPLLAALSLALVHCGGDDLACGPGSKLVGDRCVAEVLDCGAGTKLVDGRCEPLCDPGQAWNGSECVDDTACAPGTERIDGGCVPACPDGEFWDGNACAVLPSCGDGTTFDEDAGACVPNDSLCAEGTHFDGGVCVPDTESCGPGTHLDGGTCVPDQLPDPDVPESADPTGEASFDLPDAGNSITLGGTVDTPEDRDGDGYVDPDYDYFTFSATAGTWLRIQATSEGAAHPAFVIVSDASDAGGAPLYVRYALNPGAIDVQREVYLPFDGDYRLIVSDYSHVSAELFGWLGLPVGGDDFTYHVGVDNLGEPSPSTVSAVPASESGSTADGALSFVELSGLQQHDVRVIHNLGMPSGKMHSDVFAALLLFGPDVPDTADTTLRVQLMDEGLLPVGDSASASKYGPAKLRTFAEADQRTYLLLRGNNGDEVPSYTLDVRTPVADLLSSGTTHTGLGVVEMPPDTYPSAGLGRYTVQSGQVFVVNGFATSSPAWTDPVQRFLTVGMQEIPPALDVTDPSFPNSTLTPLLAYAPGAGYGLYEATDASGGDIAGATYDVSFYAMTPDDLGTPSSSQPVGQTGQVIGASGLAAFSFTGAVGQTVTVAVTPEASAQLQPEVWVATPGHREYASGTHSWISNEGEPALGVSRAVASAAGEAVAVQHDAPYDGVQLVFVLDASGNGATDTFDIDVEVAN
ncbi:MAG: hypothetical protein ACOC1F_10235 [Myxococcota bacterium]